MRVVYIVKSGVENCVWKKMNLDESFDGKLYGNGMVVVVGLLVVFMVVFFLSIVVGKKKILLGFLLWFVVGNFFDLFVLLYWVFCNFVIKYGGFMYLCLGVLDFGYDVFFCWMLWVKFWYNCEVNFERVDEIEGVWWDVIVKVF